MVIADLGTGAHNMKLKVYKGTSLVNENTIIDLPTGVATFYMDTIEPRVPGMFHDSAFKLQSVLMCVLILMKF